MVPRRTNAPGQNWLAGAEGGINEGCQIYSGRFCLVANSWDFYFTGASRELHRARPNMRSVGRWSQRKLQSSMFKRGWCVQSQVQERTKILPRRRCWKSISDRYLQLTGGLLLILRGC